MNVRPRLIASIHDATAQSLPQVLQIVDLLRDRGIRNADVLVVCGCDWAPCQIDQLRRLADQGWALHGHGWTHRATASKNLRHRLHSWTISRNVAEHLSKNEREIAAIIQRTYDWFAENRLPSPSTYVPPAWAMGSINRKRLKTLPYRFYESLNGVYDSREDQFHRLSLLGFEADTRFRAAFLRLFNRINLWRSSRLGRTLRMAIHPEDLQLRLAGDLRRTIDRFGKQVRCGLDWVLGDRRKIEAAQRSRAAVHADADSGVPV